MMFSVKSADTRLAITIRVHRMLSAVSQRELAERLGVTPGYVSQLESGARRPSDQALIRIIRTIDQIATEDQP